MKSIEVKTCKGNRKSISLRSDATQKSTERKFLGSRININGNTETVMHVVFYGF